MTHQKHHKRALGALAVTLALVIFTVLCIPAHAMGPEAEDSTSLATTSFESEIQPDTPAPDEGSELPGPGTQPPEGTEGEEQPGQEVAMAEFGPFAATLPIDTVAELALAAAAADEGDVLQLSAAFGLDFATNGPVVLSVGHQHSFAIDGSAAGALSVSSGLHFDITAAGGTITLRGFDFVGTAGASGGVKLAGGNYRFEDVNFTHVGPAVLRGTGTEQISLVGGVWRDTAGTGVSSFQSLEIDGAEFYNVAKPVVGGNAGRVELSGFVLDGYTGVGIDVQTVQTVRIQNSRLMGGSDGAALRNGLDTEIDNTLFAHNRVVAQHYGQGAAILLTTRSRLRITNSSFIENHSSGTGSTIGSTPGGAIAANQCTELDLQIENSYFTGNSIQNQPGGAIGFHNTSNSTVVIKDSVFEANETRGNVNVADGGAISWKNNSAGSSKLTIEGCNFTANKAGNDGGAMLLEGGQTVDRLETLIINCTFTQNRAGVDFSTKSCGSAIQFYGMTRSTITHCTFYANSVSSGLGTGGAVSLNTASGKQTPAPPVLSNNIFVANTAGLGKGAYGNVYIMPEADADPSDPAEPLTNNGNVGFDNGASGWSGGQNSAKKVTVANVFANLSGGVPVREYFGDSMGAVIGADNYAVQRFCFVVSPRTDEMYRDGSGPYYDPDVRTDVRGYPRDDFPNAGAVEIYWTKFDPNTARGGSWDVVPPNSIQSLLDDEIYYLVTEPGGSITTFPRSSITLPIADPAGFAGWRGNQPTNPAAPDPADYDYPLVQPGVVVRSTKQTFVAEWIDEYRVDFEPNGGSYVAPILNVPHGSTITEPAPPAKSNATFKGWYKDAALAQPWDFGSDEVTQDTLLYAKWEDTATTRYTVRYVTAPGVPAPPDEQVAPGQKVTQPTPPSRTGYDFLGWEDEHAALWNFGTDLMPAADLTLYARWRVHTHSVRFEYNDGTGYARVRNMDFGALVPKPATPTRSGYIFKGWLYGGSRYWVFESDRMPDHDIVLVAQWEREGPVTPPEPSSSSSSSRPRVSSSSTTSPPPASSEAPAVSSAPAPSSAPPVPSSAPAPAQSSAPPTITLFGNQLPLGGLDSTGTWSLVNLILSLGALLSAVLALVLVLVRRKQEQQAPPDEFETTDETARRWTLVSDIASILSGVVPLVLFLLLERFTQLVLINHWTPLFGVLALLHAGLCIWRRVRVRATQRR